MELASVLRGMFSPSPAQTTTNANDSMEDIVIVDDIDDNLNAQHMLNDSRRLFVRERKFGELYGVIEDIHKDGLAENILGNFVAGGTAAENSPFVLISEFLIGNSTIQWPENKPENKREKNPATTENLQEFVNEYIEHRGKLMLCANLCGLWLKYVSRKDTYELPPQQLPPPGAAALAGPAPMPTPIPIHLVQEVELGHQVLPVKNDAEKAWRRTIAEQAFDGFLAAENSIRMSLLHFLHPTATKYLNNDSEYALINHWRMDKLMCSSGLSDPLLVAFVFQFEVPYVYGMEYKYHQALVRIGCTGGYVQVIGMKNNYSVFNDDENECKEGNRDLKPKKENSKENKDSPMIATLSIEVHIPVLNYLLIPTTIKQATIECLSKVLDESDVRTAIGKDLWWKELNFANEFGFFVLKCEISDKEWDALDKQTQDDMTQIGINPVWGILKWKMFPAREKAIATTDSALSMSEKEFLSRTALWNASFCDKKDTM